MADPKEAVAVKAFSLTILSRFTQQYPEIIPEIKLLIEDQYLTKQQHLPAEQKSVLKEMKEKSTKSKITRIK